MAMDIMAIGKLQIYKFWIIRLKFFSYKQKNDKFSNLKIWVSRQTLL